MNRQDATALIQRYKDFPHTEIFGVQPYNYPLFHLLECYSKGWRIDRVIGRAHSWTVEQFRNENIPFEELADEIRRGIGNNIWRYVARNPNVIHPAIGFVQEDLYARYVGKCNPLKTSSTTWGFTPFETIEQKINFRGHIGKHTPVYCLEIDMDTTNIVGERDKKVPWHYLQQTINWKPFTDRIEWRVNQDTPQ